LLMSSQDAGECKPARHFSLVDTKNIHDDYSVFEFQDMPVHRRVATSMEELQFYGAIECMHGSRYAFALRWIARTRRRQH
jgi:hypothetical protein